MPVRSDNLLPHHDQAEQRRDAACGAEERGCVKRHSFVRYQNELSRVLWVLSNGRGDALTLERTQVGIIATHIGCEVGDGDVVPEGVHTKMWGSSREAGDKTEKTCTTVNHANEEVERSKRYLQSRAESKGI